MARPKTRTSIHVRILATRLKIIDELAKRLGITRTQFLEDAADLLIEKTGAIEEKDRTENTSTEQR
jgi:hypothetical protein